MPVRDPMHRGKANAGAGKSCFGVLSLERREELSRVGHIESGAVVAHEVRGDAACDSINSWLLSLVLPLCKDGELGANPYGRRHSPV
jgi:hypothetical protein